MKFDLRFWKNRHYIFRVIPFPSSHDWMHGRFIWTVFLHDNDNLHMQKGPVGSLLTAADSTVQIAFQPSDCNVKFRQSISCRSVPLWGALRDASAGVFRSDKRIRCTDSDDSWSDAADTRQRESERMDTPRQWSPQHHRTSFDEYGYGEGKGLSGACASFYVDREQYMTALYFSVRCLKVLYLAVLDCHVTHTL